MEPCKPRFGVNRAIVRPPARERGRQRAAVDVLRREADEVEQCRRDVDDPDRAADARSCAGATGQPQNSRHVQRFAVQEDAVLRFAVIVQSFAVIRYDGDDRLVEQSLRLKPREKPADQFVRICDFAVVWVRQSVRRRRIVRRVRLVQVEEREQPCGRLPIDPRGERLDGQSSIALRLRQRFTGAGDFDRVVVKIEAASDAGLVSQHVRRHGRARRVAGGLESIGNRLAAGDEAESDVVAHAVMQRQQSCEQRRMRRQRQRTVTVEIVEDDPVAAETVEDGRVAASIAVERKVIGAQRVDRDEDHRCAAIHARRRRTTAAPAVDRQHDEQGCDGHGESSRPRACVQAQLILSEFWIECCPSSSTAGGRTI